MKLRLENTSRHPDHAVKWLVNYAARYVREEAVRCGWAGRFDARPIQVQVTNCSHSYRGRSLGVRWVGSDRVRCFLVRVGSPEQFPVNSKYARYNQDDMPDARLDNWQEAVVGLTAHELSHMQYDYSSGDRKSAEIACELTEVDCVERFRRERSQYDEAMHRHNERAAERQFATAAKRSPEALAATALGKAETALARWRRKAKLAATKVRHYERAARRASRRLEQFPEGLKSRS